MDSIIHQARSGDQEQAELAALTGNERSRHSSTQNGRGGGFFRQLFCCFRPPAVYRPPQDDQEEPKEQNESDEQKSPTPELTIVSWEYTPRSLTGAVICL
jgi:hypothetical protein